MNGRCFAIAEVGTLDGHGNEGMRGARGEGLAAFGLLFPSFNSPAAFIKLPPESQCRCIGPHMDDLHAPTVTSGPTSAGYSNGVPKNQLSLQQLIAEKDRVETELKALGQVLDSVCVASIGWVPMLIILIAWRFYDHDPDHLRRFPARRH